MNRTNELANIIFTSKTFMFKESLLYIYVSLENYPQENNIFFLNKLQNGLTIKIWCASNTISETQDFLYLSFENFYIKTALVWLRLVRTKHY